MGYCHPIFVGCNDSSIVIACRWGTFTLLEEERQGDLPSKLQLAVVELCASTLENVLSDP